jgi:cob(I)alamin adenosyltransferase
MLIVFTGNGKGKTTAALGQAARMVGRGKKVLMIQWIKGPWKSGEDFVEIAPSFVKTSAGKGEFKLVKMGLGFVGILGDKLPREKHREAAREALRFFQIELASKKWDTFILDEINVALSLKLLKIQEVLTAIKKAPLDTFVIVTGRAAPAGLVKAADLVTEMKEIKHPFNNGKLAKIALEF